MAGVNRCIASDEAIETYAFTAYLLSLPSFDDQQFLVGRIAALPQALVARQLRAILDAIMCKQVPRALDRGTDHLRDPRAIATCFSGIATCFSGIATAFRRHRETVSSQPRDGVAHQAAKIGHSCVVRRALAKAVGDAPPDSLEQHASKVLQVATECPDLFVEIMVPAIARLPTENLLSHADSLVLALATTTSVKPFTNLAVSVATLPMEVLLRTDMLQNLMSLLFTVRNKNNDHMYVDDGIASIMRTVPVDVLRQSVAPLLINLDDENAFVRLASADAFSKLSEWADAAIVDHGKIFSVIRPFLDSLRHGHDGQNVSMAGMAAQVLTRLPVHLIAEDRVIAALLKLLGSSDHIAAALAKLPVATLDTYAGVIFGKIALENNTGSVRLAAVCLLRNLSVSTLELHLAVLMDAFVRDPHAIVRGVAAKALSKLPSPVLAKIPNLVSILEKTVEVNHDWLLEASAKHMLEKLGHVRAEAGV